MEHHANLSSVIGDRRSVVITCLECFFDIEERGKGNAFRYTALANALHPEDMLQRNALISFVEFKGCSQIIVVGHYDCHALEYILNTKETSSPVQAIQPQLRKLIADNHLHLAPPDKQKRLLAELNVLHQCRTLMNMSDFQERITAGTLVIKGIIVDPPHQINKQIFHNGYSYNHVINVN